LAIPAFRAFQQFQTRYTVSQQMRICLLLSAAVLPFAALAIEEPSAASLGASIRQLSLDPAETYHVRDLRISRGDIKLYLTDGILSFATPIAGRPIAAVFTTVGVDAGDAEVLVVPPGRGERASLAYFAHTPTLDEHFDRAVFLFTDGMHEEVVKQVRASGLQNADNAAKTLSADWDSTLRNLAGDLDVPIIANMLNRGPAALGLFYAVIGGRSLGTFDLTYEPKQFESNAVGRVAYIEKSPRLQIWTSFPPRRRDVPVPPDEFKVENYRIEATIHDDLRVSAATRFRLTPQINQGRAIELQISQLMHVTAASINGEPAEVFQHESVRGSDEYYVSGFLVVSSKPLAPGQPVEVEVHHEGYVIKDAGEDVYFVEARNVWFPHRDLESSGFDLIFRCPARLRVVSSGRLISETVDGEQRVVHRTLTSPEQFVGFNVGDFVGVNRDQSPFHIECFANRFLLKTASHRDLAASSHRQPFDGSDAPLSLESLATETGRILEEFSRQWGPLPETNVAVTPIPGTFGQGFPGLIYLSTVSYLPTEQRPPQIRDSILNVFYSDVLLAHEVAHQWWGNLVMPGDYRTDWLMEALANYAALQDYERKRGPAAFHQIMAFNNAELTQPGPDGKVMEAVGPVDLGIRLKNSSSENAWRIVIYDKGTFIIRMLHHRLGNAGFRDMLRALASEYAGKKISNEEFRKLAARFLPKSDPDSSLELFFDAWVYGTGIPKLSIKSGRPSSGEYTLMQTGVDDDFTVDVPIIIKTGNRAPLVKWIRSSSDGTPFTAPAGPSVEVFLPSPTDFLYLPQ
jgi:peptidase M1-like protein